jgi:hypothetical protein
MLGFFRNAFANDSPNLLLDAHRLRRGVREVMLNIGPRRRNDFGPAGNEKGGKTSLAQVSQYEQGHLLLACCSEYPAHRSVQEDNLDQALDRHFGPHGTASRLAQTPLG